MEKEKNREVNLRFKPHWLIKALAILFSLLLVFLLSQKGPLHFPALIYKENLLHYSSLPTNRVENFFHDFDHDGYSEFIQFKYTSTIFRSIESGIKVFRYNGGLIDQWNFQEPWVLQEPVFGDLDNDGLDEVIIFTVAHDSLFLYAVDIQQKLRFKIYRKFLLHAPHPNPNPKKVWDLYSVQGFVLDGDHDGYPDIYFLVRAGFSLQPRQLFAYSVHKDSLWSSPKSGALISHPNVLITPLSQKDTLIYFEFCNTPGNFHQPFPYDDHSAWFMVFNPNLQFEFNPVPFKHFGTNIFIKAKWVQNQWVFWILKRYNGELNIAPQLYLFNAQGQLIKEKQLRKHKENITNWTWPVINYSDDFIIRDFDGNLYQVNLQLELKKVYKIPPSMKYHYFIMDINKDGENEIFITGLKYHIILDSHFKEIVRVKNINRLIPGRLKSIQYRGKKNPGFLFYYSEGKEGIVYFEPNPNLVLAMPLRILTFSGSYFIFYWLFLWIYRGLFYVYLLNEMFRHHPNGMCIIYDNRQVAWMNSNFIRYFGLPGVQNAYQNYQEEFVHIPPLVDFIHQLFVQNIPLEKEIALPQEGGKQLRGKLKGIPIHGKTGMIMGYLIEYIDRESPEIMERWRIWSNTIKKLAHDIKTPLATIWLNIQSLQLKLNEMHPEIYTLVENDLQMTAQEVQRVREVTKNFLKFSNIDSPQFQQCSLRLILDKTVKHFNNYLAGGLTIQVEIEDSVDIIWADPQQLEMVFQILLENAIDAIKGKGIILISATAVQYPDDYFRQYVEIDIADTGTGIPENVQKKIFEPYFTTKREGTGLGLTIAQKIIEDHGGEIVLTQRKGFSTVIKIILPLQEEKHGTDSSN